MKEFSRSQSEESDENKRENDIMHILIFWNDSNPKAKASAKTWDTESVGIC